MADYKNIIPFILKWEGGLSKNTKDKASSYPVPDGSGYHTNKGITWAVWSSKYGNSPNSITRFYAMNNSDWSSIFKPLYWDAIKGDDIKNQAIADLMVNWAWGSGIYTPVTTLQKILGVQIDGKVGPKTIAALNSANQGEVFNKLKASNIAFFNNLSNNPAYAMFKTGWFNRLNDLYNNYLPAIKTAVKGIFPLLGLALVVYIYYKNK
jgi:hypothetical protein